MEEEIDCKGDNDDDDGVDVTALTPGMSTRPLLEDAVFEEEACCACEFMWPRCWCVAAAVVVVVAVEGWVTIVRLPSSASATARIEVIAMSN